MAKTEEKKATAAVRNAKQIEKKPQMSMEEAKQMAKKIADVVSPSLGHLVDAVFTSRLPKKPLHETRDGVHFGYLTFGKRTHRRGWCSL